MSTLQSVARFKIYPGKLAEFKKLSAECMRLAREKDKGTLRYELFFNEEQTECVVYEEYVDAEACVDHFKNMGETAAAIFKTGEVSGEIWGILNEAMTKGVAGQNIKVYRPYMSLSGEAGEEKE